MRRPQIAILTDFGISDNYNGVMEGVIRKINPYVDITYISPNAKEFNIYAGAYMLYTAYRYFQKGTIFLVVIDPGVGTKRKAIIVKTKNYYFVGPDNGVLYPAIAEDGIQEVIEITNPKMYLSKNISNTFHGRDIFSVTAAYLSLNVKLEVFGNQLEKEKIEKLSFNFTETTENNKKIYCGKIIYIDHFGNVATSIKTSIDKRQKILVKHKGKSYEVKIVRTFGQGAENQLLIYSNGYGFLEIGINKGNASIVINANEGDDICLEAYTQEDSNHSTKDTYQ
ncbi:S-adenosyl-l-methionine hydroxide adenosyltransferase family protein [Sulfurisphaera javensis]